MKSVTTIFAAAIGLALSASGQEASRTNVLFVSIDDLNDWIGCMKGHPQALTPNIDRLAAQGVLFTNAHCPSPACRPSRAAIFSGKMPAKTGVWSNRSKGLKELQPQALRLPQPFANAGYLTLGAGKLIHNRRDQPFQEYLTVEQRWSPISRKDSLYKEGELPTKGTNDPRHFVRNSKGQEVVLPLNRMPSDRAPTTVAGESFDWGAWDVPDSDFGDTQVTDWAMKKLREPNDKPLFLAVGYYRPHIPLWAPKRFFKRFENDPGKLPPYREDDLEDLSGTAKNWAKEPVTAGSHATVVKHREWEKAVEAYLACVTYVDFEVGRLLEALEKSPYADNTMIVLWSDHGWHLGEKDHWGKWTGWERSTRVPLIITPPKNKADQFAKGGAICESPVGLIDLYPTLTEFCGVTPPSDLDGQSLIPLLKDPKRKTGRQLVTVFDKGNYSVRTERWRYIRYQDGAEELYDMVNDPNEWTNLSSKTEHQELIAELRQ